MGTTCHLRGPDEFDCGGADDCISGGMIGQVKITFPGEPDPYEGCEWEEVTVTPNEEVMYYPLDGSAPFTLPSIELAPFVPPSNPVMPVYDPSRDTAGLPSVIYNEPRTEMVCEICGCYSSARICWHCSTNPGVHALQSKVRELEDEIARLRRKLRRAR